MERFKTLAALVLLASLAAPGCTSALSKQGRQQAAYRRHVRKVQHDHQKQLAKANREANRPLHRPPELSPPVETISLDSSGGSESAGAPALADGGSGQPSP